jgi:hypothetical protein
MILSNYVNKDIINIILDYHSTFKKEKEILIICLKFIFKTTLSSTSGRNISDIRELTHFVYFIVINRSIPIIEVNVMGYSQRYFKNEWHFPRFTINNKFVY